MKDDKQLQIYINHSSLEWFRALWKTVFEVVFLGLLLLIFNQLNEMNNRAEEVLRASNQTQRVFEQMDKLFQP